MSKPDDKQDARADVTERETEFYRQSISEFSAHPYVAVVRDNAIVRKWAGSGISELTGYEIEELEEEHDLWLNIIHHADKGKVSAAFECLLSGLPLLQEYRIFTKNGQLRWVRETCIPGQRLEGSIQVTGVVVDITQRKSSEDRILRLSAAVDSATEGIGLADLDFKPFYINQALRDMFGYTLDDYVQHGIVSKFINPKILLEELAPTVRSGKRWQGEVDMISKDGRRLVVDLRAAPVFDKQGNMTGMMATHTDITRRKSAEKALKESEELLRATKNSIAANMAVVDRNGFIIAVNEAWEQFARENGDPTFEHTGLGMNYLEVCRGAHGRFSDEAREALEGLQAILEGRQDQFEMEYECPSPTEFGWYLMRARQLNGEYGGLVATHINITKRKNIDIA